jgi:hypothetical protein
MVFVATLWIFLPVFYIFQPSLVVELAQCDTTSLSFSLSTAKRLSCCGFGFLARHIPALNWSESKFPPLRAIIDLVEGVSIWGVPGLEVDSFVHEVRTFDRHLPVCAKVDQSEAIFICTPMQAVLSYCWLM